MKKNSIKKIKAGIDSSSLPGSFELFQGLLLKDGGRVLLDTRWRLIVPRTWL